MIVAGIIAAFVFVLALSKSAGMGRMVMETVAKETAANNTEEPEDPTMMELVDNWGYQRRCFHALRGCHSRIVGTVGE